MSSVYSCLWVHTAVAAQVVGKAVLPPLLVVSAAATASDVL
jgi:hypothetical protein